MLLVWGWSSDGCGCGWGDNDLLQSHIENLPLFEGLCLSVRLICLLCVHLMIDHDFSGQLSWVTH